jgi:hypothetical protein
VQIDLHAKRLHAVGTNRIGDRLPAALSRGGGKAIDAQRGTVQEALRDVAVGIDAEPKVGRPASDELLHFGSHIEPERAGALSPEIGDVADQRPRGAKIGESSQTIARVSDQIEGADHAPGQQAPNLQIEHGQSHRLCDSLQIEFRNRPVLAGSRLANQAHQRRIEGIPDSVARRIVNAGGEGRVEEDGEDLPPLQDFQRKSPGATSAIGLPRTSAEKPVAHESTPSNSSHHASDKRRN